MPEIIDENNGVEAIHVREITLADGRYLIFYTFGDDEGEVTEEPKVDV